MFRTLPPERVVPLVLVHHANQNLITDSYDNREGITEVVDRFAAVLDLHQRYRIPLHLHLSGTLIEAIAWRRPDFFVRVRDLLEEGLLDIVGSCYSQNIMPFFSEEQNLRQLNEELSLITRFLGVPARRIRTAWIPERVWNTGVVAPALRHRALRNGGYHAVLLDDRLIYPAGPAYAGSPRAAFDRQQSRWIRGGLYGHSTPDRPSAERAEIAAEPAWRCHEIAQSGGLVLLPIAFALRHLIPPQTEDAFDQLREVIARVRESGPSGIAVYGDDLEKVAGVGPWASENLDRYETLLAWLQAQQDIAPVLLSQRLRTLRPAGSIATEPGAFYELARLWQAGEDYQGWWQHPAWEPYAAHFRAAERAIVEARAAGGNRALLELAEKHLMVCAYETGWQVPGEHGLEPAPWSRATASHVRACRVLAAAARWMAQRDGQAHAFLEDIDQDGEQELVLANNHLFAVFSPSRGGRLVYLFDVRGKAGKLVVGNPSDDWNWQEELNRAMDYPSNHPGACADAGGEHLPYRAEIVSGAGAQAKVVLTQEEPAGALAGLRKVLELDARSRALAVTYQPSAGGSGETRFCLSPDYLRLLRQGKLDLAPLSGPHWRGWRNGPTSVWVASDGPEAVTWRDGDAAEVGHGCVVRVAWSGPTCFRIGVGRPPGESPRPKPRTSSGLSRQV